MTLGDEVIIKPYNFATKEYQTDNSIYGLLGTIVEIGTLNNYKVRTPWNNNAGFLEWWFDEIELEIMKGE